MARSTAPYCLGMWRDAKCTLCAVMTLSATHKPAQHCLQHPRPFLCRAWRWPCWAVSPRVALPSQPWHCQRHRTAWAFEEAPHAALLKFLPSRLLRRSRSATSPKQPRPWCVLVAPMMAARPGAHQPGLIRHQAARSLSQAVILTGRSFYGQMLPADSGRLCVFLDTQDSANGCGLVAA